MNTFKLEIVTPTKILEKEEVSYIRCPGLDGLFGIMAGHTESIFALDIGEIKLTKNNKDQFFATSGGFAEVMGEEVHLLLETVEKSDEIDSARAKSAVERAEERLKSEEGIDDIRARTSLSKAVNRLKILSK